MEQVLLLFVTHIKSFCIHINVVGMVVCGEKWNSGLIIITRTREKERTSYFSHGRTCCTHKPNIELSLYVSTRRTHLNFIFFSGFCRFAELLCGFHERILIIFMLLDTKPLIMLDWISISKYPQACSHPHCVLQ